MSIQDVVNVTITRESASITRAGFGTAMFLSEHTEFSERIRFYSSLTAVAVDFISTTEEYKAAAKAFSQDLKPVQFAIGRIDTLDANLAETLDAIVDENDDWYCLLLDSRLSADIVSAAAWIETKKKIFIASSDDADVLTAVGTDVASLLQAASYARTAYLWSADTANYPDAAWVGKMLPRDPGVATWALKTLVGIIAEGSGAAAKLTDTEKNNAKGKNANIYILINGKSVTQGPNGGGVVAEGEYLDIIRSIDWMAARQGEGILTVLTNEEKVPFTDQGFAQVENPVRENLQLAERRVILAAQEQEDGSVLPAFEITVPLASSFTTVQKGTRTFDGLEWIGRLAGAIHVVEVTGKVVL